VKFTFVFPANAKTPRLARRALDGQLAFLGPDAESRLRLAMSEVVTNAIRHGRLKEDDEVEVHVDLRDRVAHVSVRQPSTAGAALEEGPRQDDGGLGLQLVDAVTDRWGVEPGPPGVVWFEIAAGLEERP
jgi:two-component sensor histidine kinase